MHTSTGVNEPGINTYLNDHLAGPAFAAASAHNCLRRTENDALKAFLRVFIADLKIEGQTLWQVIQTLGFSPAYSKLAAAWLAEKGLRLKLLDGLRGRTARSEFEQLEVLRLGVQGKRGLWAFLAKVATLELRLGAFDFASLIRRADEQIDALEHFRMEAGVRLVVLAPSAA